MRGVNNLPSAVFSRPTSTSYLYENKMSFEERMEVNLHIIR